MKDMRIYLLSFFLGWAPLGSWAAIDPATGEFQTVSVDGGVPVGDLMFEFRRFHRSGSDRAGHFGRGWCSFLDEELKIEDSRILWSYCGTGRTVEFTIKTGGGFAATNARGYHLIRENGEYRMRDPSGLIRGFDGRGRVMSWKAPVDGAYSLRRSSAKLWVVRSNRGEEWKINLNDQSLITGISGPGLSLAYDYLNDRLTGLKSGSRSIRYAHDGEGRLTEITENGRVQKMKYLGNGSLASLLHGGCEEKLAFRKSGSNVKTTVELVCPSVTARREYETRLDSNGRILAQSQSEAGTSRSIEIDPRSGHPARILDGKGETSFKYDESGRLTSKKSAGAVREYRYNSAGRLSKYLYQQGPVRQEISYEYNHRGQLTSVKSGTSTWSLAYHPDGRLSALSLGTDRLIFAGDGKAAFQNSRQPASHRKETRRAAEFHLRFLSLTRPLSQLEALEKGIY